MADRTGGNGTTKGKSAARLATEARNASRAANNGSQSPAANSAGQYTAPNPTPKDTAGNTSGTEASQNADSQPVEPSFVFDFADATDTREKQDEPISFEQAKEKAQEKAKTVVTPPTQLAGYFILIFESLIANYYGDEAKLTEHERKLIEPPLRRILERMPKETAAKVGNLADPITLFFGIMLYFSRIRRIERPKKQQTVSATDNTQATGATMPPTNGAVSDIPANAVPTGVRFMPTSRDQILFADDL